LAGLAQIAAQTGDYNTAIDYLKRATDAAPSSWRFHEKLAEAYLHQQQFDEAQKQALRAIEQGKERAATAQFVMAKIVAKNNDQDWALKALEAFLVSQPTGPQAVEARRMEEALRPPAPAPAAATVASAPAAHQRSASEKPASNTPSTANSALAAGLMPA